MSDSIIRLEHISFSYEEKEVLHDINLDIKRGMFLGLIGPNGGGKTTLINIILGLLTPSKGNVFLLNEPLQSFSGWNKIGFVAQKANTFNKGFPATVFEVVAMGLTAKIGLFKFFTKKHKEKVLEALKLVDMEQYAYTNIGELSGGQQQRIFIARAIVSEPELLILDEPTVGVDVENVERFFELLHKLNDKQQLTLLLVTHDTNVMAKYVSHVTCLNETIQFHGTIQQFNELTNEQLANIYGHKVHPSIAKH